MVNMTRRVAGARWTDLVRGPQAREVRVRFGKVRQQCEVGAEVAGSDVTSTRSQRRRAWCRAGDANTTRCGPIDHWVISRLHRKRRCSPLTFDPAEGFSDRSFDRAARAWVAKNTLEGCIQRGAVSVRPFSRLPALETAPRRKGGYLLFTLIPLRLSMPAPLHAEGQVAPWAYPLSRYSQS